MKKYFIFSLLFISFFSSIYIFATEIVEIDDTFTNIETSLEKDSQITYKYHLARAKILLEQIDLDISEAKKESNVDLANSLLSRKKIVESQIELLQEAINMSEKDQVESHFFKYIILGVSGILIVSILILLIYTMALRYKLKDSQKQQETFLQILEKASFIQEDEELAHNEETTASSSLDLKTIKAELALIKKKQLDDNEFIDLKNLSIQCEVVGRKVDKATGRKNNSKNVADLVFKLSHELGCTSYEALIYYCAALIFDVGFLYINQKIFGKPEITEDEKKEIRSHVDRGKEELVFIPQKYRLIFEVAVSLHHENNDGSGYPNALTKKDIPLLARMIRVAETYIALVTRRNYRGIFDRDSAFLELKKESEKYDKDVLAALFRVL